MKTKFYKNEKFQIWFFSILYFLLAFSIVITGCLTFKKVYYQPIVVTGSSMFPTLAGGNSVKDIHGTSRMLRSHYGLADLHRASINDLHRFDVVVTYYPQSWSTDSSFKIKRVWGFPGETITMTFNPETLSYKFTAMKPGEIPFTITSSEVKSFTQTFEYSYSDGSEVKYDNAEFAFTVNEFVLPHKTFRVSYTTPDKPHAPSRVSGKITSDTTREFVKKLADDEYFVMGDNWRGSTDCAEHLDGKLTSNYLQGRVVCITSYTSYINGETKNNHDIERIYEF